MYPTLSLASADGSLYVAPFHSHPFQGFDYQDAVGESLIEIMRATPGGVLVSPVVEVWGHVLCAHSCVHEYRLLISLLLLLLCIVRCSSRPIAC